MVVVWGAMSINLITSFCLLVIWSICKRVFAGEKGSGLE